MWRVHERLAWQGVKCVGAHVERFEQRQILRPQPVSSAFPARARDTHREAAHNRVDTAIVQPASAKGQDAETTRLERVSLAAKQTMSNY